MIDYAANITKHGLSIYDPINKEDDNLFVKTHDLEIILSSHLLGISLAGLALRSRSKYVKEMICKALGYPIPKSFKKTQPRFLGQNFDVYIQKNLNVQIWNEDIVLDRRYVFIKVDTNYTIESLRVVHGTVLKNYDKTNTLTKKYQAFMKSYGHNICSTSDTKAVREWHSKNNIINQNSKPNDIPTPKGLLTISKLFEVLSSIIGMELKYLASDQERNRGAELHKIICSLLGYSHYADDGCYPDIMNQLLEIKLQTSPTIDLGCHYPNDDEVVVVANDHVFTHKDIRYAIVEGEVVQSNDDKQTINLKNLYLVTGDDFEKYFSLFNGGKINTKLQLPLPSNFFS